MKKKLLRLILWIITIQVVISGALIAYVSWDSNMKSLSRAHSQKISYISEALSITQKNGTFINFHHFVQKMSTLKDVRVTLYDSNGRFLADSLNNTLLFQEEVEPEIKHVLSGKVGDATRVDQFTKQLSFYSARKITSGGTQFILVLSSSIEPLKSELLLLVRHIVLAIVIGFLIAISTGYRFVKQYTDPIVGLKESANTIANGHYAYELDTSAPDEVGELAEVFEKMTESVRTAITDLSESNAHMNAVIHEMFGGLVGIDLEDHVFIMNPIAEKILGVSLNQFVNKDYKTMAFPKAIMTSIEEVKQKQHETTHRITLENGTVLLTQNAPIRKENGVLIGYVIVLFDITEKTRLAELQREFFTNVSHEIRTPLTSIQGFIETLENYKHLSDENMDSILAIMIEESERLSGLLDTIMDIARFDMSQEEIKKAAFDIQKSIDQVVHEHKHLAEIKALSIHIQGLMDNSKSMLQVIQNKAHFETILSNLLSNAIKYSPEKSRIDIELALQADYLSVTVSDKGPGIDAKHLDKIFKRFYRCDPSRNSKVPGYGLGLYIAKSLCDACGVNLEVDSELGHGTQFTISHIECASIE